MGSITSTPAAAPAPAPADAPDTRDRLLRVFARSRAPLTIGQAAARAGIARFAAYRIVEDLDWHGSLVQVRDEWAGLANKTTYTTPNRCKR
ncbi:helix-turn-helix domain-containing protein [Alienimonas sp. DA493]|uniref:helix-turn-helix domain-containing protein n=1 Tax=Alienimonas sp. DA493 TaxID=3373605 RepID=UPI003753EBE8